VGGNPELVEDGVTGRLVPRYADDALVEAIARYATYERMRRAHGAAGRERVLQHFTLEHMVQRYEALYRSEVARRSPVSCAA